MDLSITLIIVIITVLVSIGAFNNEKMMNDLIFYPPSISKGQWYRFITHGFIHADVAHLAFNMIALYSFGEVVEQVYTMPWIFGSNGKLVYIFLYFSALIIASVPDFIKHKDNYYYRSLGASGAVSAVIFSSILFNPNGGIRIYFFTRIEYSRIYIRGFIYYYFFGYGPQGERQYRAWCTYYRCDIWIDFHFCRNKIIYQRQYP